MAKKKILWRMLALALTFGMSLTLLSCDDSGGDDGGSSGKLTITGLEDINGKYVFVGSSAIETGIETGTVLMGMGDSQKNTGVLVSGGKAELKVYKVTLNYEKQQTEASSYSGSDSNVKFKIYWKTTNNFSGWNIGGVDDLTKFGEVTVSFTNGSGTVKAQAQ
jgi:hypothetical protein